MDSKNKPTKQSSATPNRGRKNNPDYEMVSVKTRDGVTQNVYRKKDRGDVKKNKNKGTPEKRRGGFKKPKQKKNLGVLNAPPSIASSMAQPLGNIAMEQKQSNAAYQLDTVNRLSGRARESLQNQKKAPKQVKMAKSRSRPEPSSGGGDGRT